MTKTKTKKKGSPIVDLAVLNSDQRHAFEGLRDFITTKEDDSIYVLKGWAGTGKTFCISVLVKYALEVIHHDHAWYKIAVTGPTNKSVRVIKKTSGLVNPRVNFQTIHSLLGLTEKITNDGEQIFTNDSQIKPTISQMKLLIIDEVSMLNDDLFQEVIKYRNKLKIICMGDPAQIPPVGKPDCIPFREELADFYKIKTLQLKKIMRQKEGNAIIDSSVQIRKNLLSNFNPVESITRLNENGEGIEFLNLNDPEMRKGFSDVLSSYFKTDTFQKDSEYAKIIAWRNVTVAKMNDIIRRVIYGDESTRTKILVGEKLIANTPIVDRQGIIILTTNEEFTVDSYEIKNESMTIHNKFDEDADAMHIGIKYYHAKVKYLDDDGEEAFQKIQILHEDSDAEFKKVSLILKTRAIQNRGRFRSWIDYFDFIRSYADINYGYSITAHKSQGSTYNTVILMEDDIDVNRNIEERNRIKYTAYTRASKKVYIVKRF
jgi:exodeoxyribonuclease-5